MYIYFHVHVYIAVHDTFILALINWHAVKMHKVPLPPPPFPNSTIYKRYACGYLRVIQGGESSLIMDHQGGEFHLMKEKCCYIFKNKCRGTFSIKNLKRCFPYISTVLRISYFKKNFSRLQIYIIL